MENGRNRMGFGKVPMRKNVAKIKAREAGEWSLLLSIIDGFEEWTWPNGPSV